MTQPLRPNFGRFDPETFTLPEKNWPNQLPERCCACGDPCTGNIMLPVVGASGEIADGLWSAEESKRAGRGYVEKPACKVCHVIWKEGGFYGDRGLDSYLRGELRGKILKLREAERHRGVSMYRVIAERYHRPSREGVFADRWAKVNGDERILHQLMVLPCRPGARGAWRDDSGSVSPTSTGRFRTACGDAPITDRECAIAATAIQWLGTNVGLSWLIDTLKEAGYEFRQVRERREP